ncbi:hypothetical protein BDP81DRAFT_464657 [Colletotrichum phormii]|uniref:Glycoside hydrolase 131 catalytic N-terminal domain-containing protein n=1 Tax=Colletotrichum phormii TaxID=359342 RepID=A0AAJ0ECB1_9PEZI|nr:uncharacterized protein BDP81DRAFT_464657 [Colletotrichum phormii]KAK1624528.1 hypothetical protein BDP81DRAFT_464657 [Colletotrichum phormii]
MQYLKSFTLLSFASVAVAQQCTLQFDGRVATGTEAEAFDAENNLFSSQNVFGAGLSFSKVLQLPNEASSPFDGNDNVPLEVTIRPSIFNKQTGFRRAELIPSTNTGTDESTTGVKTLHFSLSKDVQRPLNLSHEYQLAFLESNDFSTNQVVLKTGTILGGDATVDPDTLQLFGNVNTKPAPPVLFSTPFAENTIHNFAVTMDFNANTTVHVFYSTDNNDLEAQGEHQPNVVTGQGQYHFGILKKPVGGQGDITKNGFQPDGIDEGIVYSGIFQEDSANGCISLAP